MYLELSNNIARDRCKLSSFQRLLRAKSYDHQDTLDELILLTDKKDKYAQWANQVQKSNISSLLSTILSYAVGVNFQI